MKPDGCLCGWPADWMKNANPADHRRICANCGAYEIKPLPDFGVPAAPGHARALVAPLLMWERTVAARGLSSCTGRFEGAYWRRAADDIEARIRRLA